MRIGEEELPRLFSLRNLVLALLVHGALFLGFWCFQSSLPPDELVIPVDLTVVIQENLNGNEDEPPPVKPPEEPPPPEEVKPPPAPEPPPPKVEEPPPDAVEKIVEDKPKKKEPPKKVEEKPETSKKSAKELREERLRRMREAAKPNKDAPKPNARPQPNGRTERRPPNWQQLLNAGYKPGATTTLTTSDEQFCVSLIYQAFYDEWERPAWNSTLRPAQLTVWFDGAGRIVRSSLTGTSGDATVDRSVKAAAARVRQVRGLLPKFLEKNRASGVIINFTVTAD